MGKLRRSKCNARSLPGSKLWCRSGLRGRIVKDAKLGKSSGLLYSITKTAHVKNLQPRFSATCLLIYGFALFNPLGWRNRRERHSGLARGIGPHKTTQRASHKSQRKQCNTFQIWSWPTLVYGIDQDHGEFAKLLKLLKPMCN
jgi:hypothetical protein